MQKCEGCERVKAHEKQLNGNGQPGLQTKADRLETEIVGVKNRMDKYEEKVDNLISSLNKAAISTALMTISVALTAIWEYIKRTH